MGQFVKGGEEEEHGSDGDRLDPQDRYDYE